jgi:uncharacterized protein (DUF305 family)
MKRILATLAVALLTTTTLAACGGDDQGARTRDFNNADVTFAQRMIPHHEQAVQMAKLARTQASSPEVKALAKKIEAAQGPEIETMQGWLEEWGKSDDSDDDSMHSMDGDGMGGMHMPGMMSDHDMMRLGKGRGVDFDSMFLTMMIEHHEGAIEMARTEQSEGQNAHAKALAAAIEKAQTAEIAQMKQMLRL